MSKQTKNTNNSGKGGALYIYGKNAVTEMLKEKAKDIIEVVFVDFAKDGNLHKDKANFAEILQSVKHAKIPVRYVGKKDAEAMVGDVRTQRVLARVKPFKYLDFKDWKEQVKKEKKLRSSTPKLVLVLDKVEDPQNFGAIVRSAGAVGVSAVFVANASQAPVTAAVFKTSAGVITKVPIVQVANIADTLEKLKDLGFWNYGVSMEELSEEDKESNPYAEGSKSIWDIEFDNNTVLVVGAEGSGLSRITRENCDFLVHIPMQNNVESLNVSVSAALSMYEWRRQMQIAKNK